MLLHIRKNHQATIKKNAKLQMVETRKSVGAELDHLEPERSILTDPDDNRRRRTIQLTKLNDSWGFTLQTYGVRHKKSHEVEIMTYVDYIEIEGAAWIAGMRKGDVILSVNGEGVEHATHKELVEKIKKADQTMRLVVLFEDCCHKVELHDRYIRLKRVLTSKYDELKLLEQEEQEFLEARGLSRLDKLRQSVYSKTSSDSSWDRFSFISSPTALQNTPNNFNYPSEAASLKSSDWEDNSSDVFEVDDNCNISYMDSDSDSGAGIHFHCKAASGSSICKSSSLQYIPVNGVNAEETELDLETNLDGSLCESCDILCPTIGVLKTTASDPSFMDETSLDTEEVFENVKLNLSQSLENLANFESDSNHSQESSNEEEIKADDLFRQNSDSKCHEDCNEMIDSSLCIQHQSTELGKDTGEGLTDSGECVHCLQTGKNENGGRSHVCERYTDRLNEVSMKVDIERHGSEEPRPLTQNDTGDGDTPICDDSSCSVKPDDCVSDSLNETDGQTSEHLTYMANKNKMENEETNESKSVNLNEDTDILNQDKLENVETEISPTDDSQTVARANQTCPEDLQNGNVVMFDDSDEPIITESQVKTPEQVTDGDSGELEITNQNFPDAEILNENNSHNKQQINSEDNQCSNSLSENVDDLKADQIHIIHSETDDNLHDVASSENVSNVSVVLSTADECINQENACDTNLSQRARSLSRSEGNLMNAIIKADQNDAVESNLEHQASLDLKKSHLHYFSSTGNLKSGSLTPKSSNERLNKPHSEKRRGSFGNKKMPWSPKLGIFSKLNFLSRSTGNVSFSLPESSKGMPACVNLSQDLLEQGKYRPLDVDQDIPENTDADPPTVRSVEDLRSPNTDQSPPFVNIKDENTKL